MTSNTHHHRTLTAPIPLLSLLAGTFLLIRHLTPHTPTYPAQSTTPQQEPFIRRGAATHPFATGEHVPLPYLIAVCLKRSRNPQPSHALITLTDPNFPSFPTETPQPNYTEIHWKHPDTPAEKLLSIPRTLLHATLINNLLVAPTLPALFCPVPGVASATLTTHLTHLEHRITGTDAPLHPLSAYAPRDRERLLTRTTVTRYMVSRHPFIRALSIFRAAAALPGGLDDTPYRTFMAHVRGRPLGAEEHELQRLSFLFFLTFLARQRPIELASEFRSQSAHCGVGRVRYTIFARYERLRDDIARIERAMHVHPLGVPRKTAGSNASDTAPDIFRVARYRTKATKLYGDDLINFGYSRSNFA